jgi:HSP20 family protein
MTNLVTYDPFLDTGMDELFRGFFKPVRWEGGRTPVTIKMDVTETKDGYMVHADLPGMKKENINIEIEGNQVTIMGDVKREWYRSFTLPHDIDEAKCEAKYDGGVLELKLVKKAGIAGKKLPVM